MVDKINESVELEVSLTKIAAPIAVAHLASFLAEFPVREGISVHMNAHNVMEVWPQTGIFAFQDMLEAELYRLLRTASEALAAREVYDVSDGNLAKLADLRSAIEYEHFLYRLFGFKEKTMQAWNSLRGSALEMKEVKADRIKKRIKVTGPDSMLDELKTFWKDATAVRLFEERNTVAHRHPIGPGFLAPVRMEESTYGKGKVINGGLIVGAVDWPKARDDIFVGVKLAFEARRIVTRHELNALAPWTAKTGPTIQQFSQSHTDDGK